VTCLSAFVAHADRPDHRCALPRLFVSPTAVRTRSQNISISRACAGSLLHSSQPAHDFIHPMYPHSNVTWHTVRTMPLGIL